LIEEERRGKSIDLSESSSDDDDDEDAGNTEKSRVNTTTAVAAVTLKKVLNARKPLQRLTSPAKIVEKLAL
jgi:hypothetical protein